MNNSQEFDLCYVVSIDSGLGLGDRYVCPCRVSPTGTIPGPKRRAFRLPRPVAVELARVLSRQDWKYDVESAQ